MEQVLAAFLGKKLVMAPSEFILRAARNEPSSNSWRLSVISGANFSACVVGTRPNTSGMVARNAAKVER
jgi:hypothetical protein